jgi:GNAT superfamily N-acetyltransferase
MSQTIAIRQMARPEVDQLVEWADREGWNPGLHDAASFWATDPDAFIAADLGDTWIGGGAITAYGDEFGFMGFFIVRPEFRGRGFGDRLWHVRRDRLIARLRPGATIGMDGVFAMQPYYAKGGFVFSHRDLRFRAELPAGADPPALGDHRIITLDQIPFDDVLDYDRTCFPATRSTFLRAWIAQPDSLALGCVREGVLRGYGVIRRCRSGSKIGPLFADESQIAHALLGRLASFAEGDPVFLDVPENNPAALALAHSHAMVEVFGCARMYLGPRPRLEDQRIFGVTTFELG